MKYVDGKTLKVKIRHGAPTMHLRSHSYTAASVFLQHDSWTIDRIIIDDELASILPQALPDEIDVR